MIVAFRLGFAELAAGELSGRADGGRFERLAERYRALLRTALGGPEGQTAPATGG